MGVVSMRFMQTGGGRAGGSFWSSVNWTWPFVSIGVDESAIGMLLDKRAYIIPRENVRRIRLVGADVGPPGFHGIVIEHDAASVPPYVLFWSFDRPSLIAALAGNGYVVG